MNNEQYIGQGQIVTKVEEEVAGPNEIGDLEEEPSNLGR